MTCDGARSRSRRSGGAFVADRRVDAVVEDEEPARARELDELVAALRREVGAGRVRARGLQHDELDLVAREDPLEHVDVGAVGVDRQREHARARGLERREAAGERRRLDDRDVTGAERRASDEVDRLARARGHEDLVGAACVAGLDTELGEALAQLGQALDLQVVGDGARRLAGDVGGDLRELLRRAQLGVRKPRAERDRVLRVGRVQRVAQHLVGVGQRARREHAELPVVVDRPRTRARRGRRDVAAHERAAPDGRADVAELREAPVHAHGREVVDAGVRGERARRRELGPRLEVAVVDELRDVLDELLRHRGLAVALEVQHAESV